MTIWKEFTWERPDKIFNGEEPILFQDKIEPNDI